MGKAGVAWVGNWERAQSGRVGWRGPGAESASERRKWSTAARCWGKPLWSQSHLWRLLHESSVPLTSTDISSSRERARVRFTEGRGSFGNQSGYKDRKRQVSEWYVALRKVFVLYNGRYWASLYFVASAPVVREEWREQTEQAWKSIPGGVAFCGRKETHSMDGPRRQRGGDRCVWVQAGKAAVGKRVTLDLILCIIFNNIMKWGRQLNIIVQKKPRRSEERRETMK